MVENKQDREYEKDEPNRGKEGNLEREDDSSSSEREASGRAQRVGENDTPAGKTGLEREDE